MTARQRGWRVPAALLAMSVIPVLAGGARLVELGGGPAVIPVDARFTTSPLPVIAHIVCAAVYALLGALQFAPGFRRRRPAWHRRAGRVLVVAALGVALSALWLTLLFPPQEDSGPLLFVLRLVFAPALVASLVLAVVAIRRGDVATHRAWMVRAYAIALAAGTQVLTEGVGGAVFGTSALVLDASRGAAWVVNLAVAEWAIRCRPVGGGVRRVGGRARRVGGRARRHRPAAPLVVGDRS
jgi:uncharacterized membrane protein